VINLNIFSLSKKNIFLSGGSGFLGRSMAWGLAESGANVIINSSKKKSCDVLVRDIKKAGYCAESAIFDITDEKAIRDYFYTKKKLPMHCLINNAYRGSSGTIKNSNGSSYEDSYKITLVSAHNLLRYALKNLRLAVKTDGDASIINIASMYGLVSPDLKIYKNNHNPPHYGAAKAALIQWTKYAACEFGPEKIRVNAISPGPFPNFDIRKKNPWFAKKLTNKVPLRRLGHPDEIKGLVIMLASSSASYITGANISIDGGWTSW